MLKTKSKSIYYSHLPLELRRTRSQKNCKEYLLLTLANRNSLQQLGDKTRSIYQGVFIIHTCQQKIYRTSLQTEATISNSSHLSRESHWNSLQTEQGIFTAHTCPEKFAELAYKQNKRKEQLLLTLANRDSLSQLTNKINEYLLLRLAKRNSLSWCTTRGKQKQLLTIAKEALPTHTCPKKPPTDLPPGEKNFTWSSLPNKTYNWFTTSSKKHCLLLPAKETSKCFNTMRKAKRNLLTQLTSNSKEQSLLTLANRISLNQLKSNSKEYSLLTLANRNSLN